MACQTYSLHATREEHTKLPKQTGALPWRKTSGKDLEVLLVTGRRSGVWMIPKGWPIRGKSLAKAAAQEAFEEAGVEGTVDPKPIGSFRHIKQNLGVGLALAEGVGRVRPGARCEDGRVQWDDGRET